MESKNYRHPDLQWKCGRTAHGEACPFGPDQRGRCQSQQCHPQRTLRWWRSYLSVAFAVATIGIVFGLSLTQQHREVIAPGPLSMAHAQLIHNPLDPHRCASCHEDSANRFSKSTMDSSLIGEHTQTQRCLVCHLRELPQLQRATPHDLPLEPLQTMTATAKSHVETRRDDGTQGTQSIISAWLVSLTTNHPIDWHQHRLACSDCHREHQGSEHDLQSISSQRCQACHQNQFHAFSDGHPEFSNYPGPTSGQIAFDHLKHRDLHFAKSSAQFDCRICHLNGAAQGRVGQVFRSVAFETACAACHTAPIKSSLSDGIIVFQLPSIDLQGLADHGEPIRDWPDEAGQLFDGRVPPWMQVLLLAEQDGANFLQALPSSGKLSDFNIDDQSHRQAILRLVTASRRLLGQLARDGQQELQKRLLATLDPNDQSLAEQLVRGVPPDLFRQAYRDWFDQDSQKDQVPNGLRVSMKEDRRLLRGGRDESDIKDASDVQSNNLDDNLLLTEDPLTSDLLSSDSTSALPNRSALSNDPLDTSTWKPLKALKHLEGGGWMIDRQRMAIVYIPSGHADPWLTAMLTLAGQMKGLKGLPASPESPSRVRTHVEGIAKSILAKDSAGRCLECHQSVASSNLPSDESTKWATISTPPSPTLNQHWRANRFDARTRQLTRFDHGPHLLQSSLTDCVACHRMVQNQSMAIGVAHQDFESMTVKDCASCHQPKAAGDHCTQCHNYHTNNMER